MPEPESACLSCRRFPGNSLPRRRSLQGSKQEHIMNIMIDSFLLSSEKAEMPSRQMKNMVRFGVPALDASLNGGLRRDGVHEFYAATVEDRGAASAFSLLFAAQACRVAPLMWLQAGDRKEQNSLFGPGLCELGLSPSRLVVTTLPDLAALLKAAVDSVRFGGVGAAILDIGGQARCYDLNASRRLALAAEHSGTMVMVVRRGANPAASAAHTRWQVASAPSSPLAANAPGHPVFDLTLLRQRGGRDGLHLQVEWNRDDNRFETLLPGRASALPPGEQAGQGASRAA